MKLHITGSDVTNTQWQQFTAADNKFKTDTTARLTRIEQKLDTVLAQTKPADPPTTP